MKKLLRTIRIKKVVVGLSGGVDSAVAASRLVDAGYQVTAVFLECYQGPGCRTQEDRKDALDIALKLNVPFQVLDLKKPYHDKVVDYFFKEYQAGRTPNPDTICNRDIKFGLFYDWAMDKGFDYVATGHYARIKVKSPVEDEARLWRQKSKVKNTTKNSKNNNEKNYELRTTPYELLRGIDEHKDQSYFLYLLRQEQLSHLLFPVGESTKTEVRKEAQQRGLSVAAKPDSQGICFIGEVNVKKFLGSRIKPKKGRVITKKGQPIGEHDGVWFFTIGQRGGWRLSPSYQRVFSGSLPPLYIIRKNVSKNELIIGLKEDCYQDKLSISNVHWLHEDIESRITNHELRDLKVKIRHQGELIPVKSISVIQNSKFLLQLAKRAFGVAPGQACVFYDREVCLGGGTIR